MNKKITVPTALELRKARIKQVGFILGLVSLFLAGILASVSYNGIIHHIEQNGIKQYKANHCHQYSDKNISWLDCDTK